MLSIYKTVEQLNIKVADIIDSEAKKAGIDGFEYFCSKECDQMLQDIYHTNFGLNKEELSSYLKINKSEIKEFKYSCPMIWVFTDNKDKARFTVNNEDVYEYTLKFRESKNLHNKLNKDLFNMKIDKKQYKM